MVASIRGDNPTFLCLDTNPLLLYADQFKAELHFAVLLRMGRIRGCTHFQIGCKKRRTCNGVRRNSWALANSPSKLQLLVITWLRPELVASLLPVCSTRAGICARGMNWERRSKAWMHKTLDIWMAADTMRECVKKIHQVAFFPSPNFPL